MPKIKIRTINPTKINCMELKIESKEKAKRIYDRPELVKELLEEAYGKETFQKINYKDLNSFDALCRATRGITREEFEAKLKDLQISDQAKRFMRMEVISEGINQGWEPDNEDPNQEKWFPVFKKVSSGGLVFSSSGCRYDYADADVGFPFAYKDEEHSTHSGKTFIKFWIEFITHKTL